MKTPLHLVAALITLTLTPAFGQPQATPAPGLPTVQRGSEPIPSLTRFDLDFSGGTPRQLVAAIQKAMGKPLNAIVPDEFADTILPELKVKNVNVRELFSALQATSLKSDAYVSSTHYGGGYAGGPSQSYQILKTSYGFRTDGAPSDDSIWYFYVEKPVLPPVSQSAKKVCRFYSLATELERGQTVDDITTAIQTGWKMLGDENPPKISFHKDTKLLIAVGEPSKLEIIDAVLNSLKPPPTAKLPTAEKPKTEQ